MVTDGEMDAVSTPAVGIGMPMDRAVGIAAVIVTVEIGAAVTVARVIAVAVIAAKDASAQMAAAAVAADAVAIVITTEGRAASARAARKPREIAARVRDGAMETGVTGIAVTPTGAKGVGTTSIALMAIAPTATVARGIERKAAVVMAIAEVTADPRARTQANQSRAFGRMRLGIVPSTRRCR